MWKPLVIVIFAAAILLPVYFRGNLDLDSLTAVLPAGNGGNNNNNNNGGAVPPVSADGIRRIDRDFSTGVPVDYSKTGVFFPLFAPPGRFWDQMLEYRLEHPSLPWTSVINPDNGPGRRANPLYTQYIGDLKEANVLVLGYVSTFWAGVPIEDVKQDIKKYSEFYDLDGIFFDEMSNTREYVPYYKELVEYAESLGLGYTIGNTGTDAAPEYVGVVDNIVISEGYGVPTLSRLGGWHADHDKDNFSYIAHSQTTVDRVFITTARDFASYVYVTDDIMPNPYNRFPSHFDELLEVLDGGIESDLHNLAIKSVDLAGAAVNGTLQISVTGKGGDSKDEAEIINGREWVTYVGKGESEVYTAKALDNRDYVFEHWEDGSTDRTRTVNLGNGTSATLTSYYSHKDARPRIEPGLTIAAMTEKGSTLSMWTVIESADGRTVKTGFTPLRFDEGMPGQNYRVFVADWDYFKFDRWTTGNDDSAWQSVRYTGGEQYMAAYFSYNPPSRPVNTLTVNTYDTSGQLVTMYATVRVLGQEGNETLQSGYTPWTLPVKKGEQYEVTVYDFEDLVFDQWEDGNKRRTVIAEAESQHEKLVGYYKKAASNNNNSGSSSARPALASADLR